MTDSTTETLASEEDRLIKLEQVMEIAGLGRTMVYRLIRQGRFPTPCKPGGAGSRWSLFEVREWRQAQLAARAA